MKASMSSVKYAFWSGAGGVNWCASRGTLCCSHFFFFTHVFPIYPPPRVEGAAYESCLTRTKRTRVSYVRLVSGNEEVNT